MNSKKIKDMLSNIESIEYTANVTATKSKNKNPDILNQNSTKKSKKRKLAKEELCSIPIKRLKNQINSIDVIYNPQEIPVIQENIENNVPPSKTSKRKKLVYSEETHTEEMFTDTALPTNSIQPTKKNKKKKKEVAAKSEDSTGASQETHNSSKTVEVDIVDIGEKVDNEKNENIVTISIKDVDGMDSDWDENELLKQLEKRVDKKEVSKVKPVQLDWPDSDLMELVEKMESVLPENDMKPFLKRSEELEWDKITFKQYSVEDCKKTWSLVLKKIRKYRILKEVLNDAKSWIQAPKAKKKLTKVPRHPEMPRRPLSAYFIYYLKKKDAIHAKNPGLDATELAKMCSQQFKMLSSEKMLKYENMAKKNKLEYEQKIKEFYERYPELMAESKSKKSSKSSKPPKPPKPLKEKPPPKVPKVPKEKAPKRPLSAFQYYQISEMAKNETEDKVAYKEIVRDRWKEMPDDRKMEWITYAEAETARYEEELQEYVKSHPEYVNTAPKPQLSKEDLSVKERMSGKPAKPPVSAYNFFARTLLHSDDIKDIPVKDKLLYVSNQWKKCSDEEKKYYQELFKKAIEKYNKDFAAYLETLPEEERKLEISKSKPKKLKAEDEKTKKDVKKKPPKKVEPKPAKKKAVTTKTTEKKVEKKTPTKLVEPEQPPISAYKYFAKLYNGEEPAKAWKALSPSEKKKYEEELIQKKKTYIIDFEKFLKSLTKEELEHFSNTRQKNRKVIEDDDDEDEDEDDGEDEEDDGESETGSNHSNSEDESNDENDKGDLAN